MDTSDTALAPRPRKAAAQGESPRSLEGDPIGLTPSVERLSLPARMVVAIYIVVAVGYLGWRAGTLNPQAPVFSMLVYGAELFGFATTLLHLFIVRRLTVRTAPPPPTGLTVDIFVPTLNEPVEIVRRTLLAARNIDYPHVTWLLDDGNRPAMRELAADLGVRYLARADNTHAKAGNLNNALAHSSGEFIAIFDADHAPRRNFLHETLGYFHDAGLAFVQTPQDFFNLDSYQHRKGRGRRSVWTEQSLFFRVIQRGKDASNAAFFCGSCAVIRRSALERIGGFGTATITEDLETSVALHRAGFRSAYVETPLAFGIAPATAKPFLSQRIRWGQGAMQVIRRERLFMRGKLTFAQRLNYLASTTTYFDGWQKAVFYLAPVWVLMTGSMPLIADATVFLLMFVPYFVLTFVVFEETGRGYGRAALIEQYNMARFAAFIWSTFGLLRRNLRFRVTRKDGRTATAAEAGVVAPQIVVGLLNVCAIAAGALLWMAYRHLPLHGLVANVLWASLNFGMAAAVVRFSLSRVRYRRREYRFPLAIPAAVDFEGGGAIMTVDDISSSGCRLYGAFPETLAKGDRLSGTLHLPGALLPFRARVASLIPAGNGRAYSKAIGVAFEWDSAGERDGLDVFLYGSDLQWLIHGIGDRQATITERLTDPPRARIPALGAGGGELWTAVEILGDGIRHGLALLGPGAAGGTRVVATDYRIDNALHVRDCRRRGQTQVVLRPMRELARATTPLGTVYLTEMEPC